MPSHNRVRSCYFVFTLNNPRGNLDADELQAAGVKYGIWSEEIGESGTHHFQGYIEMRNRTSFTQLKKLPGLETAHFERRMGSQDQAIAYASKVNDPTFISGPYSFGERTPNLQGTRNDLRRIQEALSNGVSLSTIAEENFSSFIRYHRGIREYQMLVHPVAEERLFTLRDFNVPALILNKAVLLWGPGGTGKTEFALAHFEKPLFVRHIDALRDFRPGFHDGVVFDDMDFSHWPHGSRVHILDMARPAQIHCRYSHAVLPRGTRRIFCSNSRYILEKDSDTVEQKSAIIRRLQIVEVSTPLFGAVVVAQPPPTVSTASTAPPVLSTFAEYSRHMRDQLVSLYTSVSDYLGSDCSDPEPTVDTGMYPTDLFP